VIEDATGRRAGRYRMHVTKPGEFDLDGARFELTREGLLVPRFHVAHEGRRLATLEYNLVSGAMTIETTDARRFAVAREGVMLPHLTVQHDGRPVVEVEAERLFGRETRARLHDAPGVDRLTATAILGLVLHARASLNLVLGAAGGAGVMAPV